MKVFSMLVSRILLSILLGIVGLILAWFVMRGIEMGRFAQWKTLGTPPDGAGRFVSYQPGSGRNTDNLYIETSSGKVYLYDGNSKHWQETKEVPVDLGMARQCDLSYDVRMQRLVSRLSQSVEDCIERTWNWEWASDRDIFVILADRSVWKLRDYTSFGLELGINCGSSLLVITVGWIIIWVIGKRKSTTMPDRKMQSHVLPRLSKVSCKS